MTMFLKYDGSFEKIEKELNRADYIDGYSYPHQDKNGSYFVGLSVCGKPRGGIIHCGTIPKMHEVTRWLNQYFEKKQPRG